MPATPPLEFEVADIRPSDPNPPHGPAGGDCFYCPGGRLNISRFTMSDLIATAWNLNGNYDSRVVGLPKSLEKVNRDVVARVSTMTPVNAPANGQPPTQQVDFDSVRIMLQALLKDRFRLALHEETRQLNGYTLVAVKPKLKPADPDGRAGDYFAQYPGRIADATNLEGRYDFTVNFTPPGMTMGGGEAADRNIGSDSSRPGSVISLPEAIEKQLGLRLEPRKNPGMVLVVDHVEEKPAQN